MILEPLLLLLVCFGFVARVKWAWKLPLRGQLAVAYALAASFALWWMYALVRTAQGDARPLIPLLVLFGVLSWTLTRARDRGHTKHVASPEDFARMQPAIDRGLALGFTAARVDTVIMPGSSNILMLNMTGPPQSSLGAIVFSSQMVSGRRVDSFSTYLDSGNVDLITRGQLEAEAPRAIHRAVDGTLADQLRSHQADVQTLILAGHQPMTAADYDLFEVTFALMNRHSADMTRQLPKTLWRLFVPDAGVLKPLQLQQVPKPSRVFEF